jgi:hypothetical protein
MYLEADYNRNMLGEINIWGLNERSIAISWKNLRNLKVLLKIKISMWFLKRKVLLNEDNLAKRKWMGCNIYCYCDSDETIEHLFSSCMFSHLIFRIVYFIFNITPPTNVTNMF